MSTVSALCSGKNLLWFFFGWRSQHILMLRILVISLSPLGSTSLEVSSIYTDYAINASIAG